MRIAYNHVLQKAPQIVSDGSKLVPTIGTLTYIDVQIGDKTIRTMLDSGAMLNVANAKMHRMAFDQFGHKVLVTPPEPLTVCGWDPKQLEVFKYGLLLPITYQGKTVQIFAWLDNKCDKELVIGSPGMAQLPVGSFP